MAEDLGRHILIIARYKVPLEIILKDIHLHRDFLNRLVEQGILVTAGRQEPYIGGIAIARHVTKEELIELFKEDPYAQKDYYDLELIEFYPRFFKSITDKNLS